MLANATELTVGSSTVLKAEEPVTLDLCLESGKARFADDKARVPVAVGRMATPVRAALVSLREAAARFAGAQAARRETAPAGIVWRVELGALPSRLCAVDLDGADPQELLVFSGSKLTALHLSGQKEWQFSAAPLRPLEPVVADLDGDGTREIVVAGRGSALHVLSTEGKLTGRLRLGAEPTAFAAGNLGLLGIPPTLDGKALEGLEDEDGDMEREMHADREQQDARKEIVFGFKTDPRGFDGRISAIDLNGRAGWSVKTKGFPRAIRIIDLDGDGKVEVFSAMSREQWYVHDVRGKVRRTNSDLGGAAAVHVLDVDGDGRLDIVGADSWYDNLVMLDGRLRRRWKQSTGEDPVGPAIVDLDGDGRHEILVGSMLGNVNCYSCEGRPYVLAAGGRTLVLLDAAGRTLARQALPSPISLLTVARRAEQPDGVVLGMEDGTVCRIKGR